MSLETPRIEVSIRSHFFPYLKEDGFGGSGRNFRRVVNEWVQVVHVQGSRHGGQFAINFGLQHLLVPDVLGNAPDPKRITEPLCEFRRRLADSGVDQWWDHNASQASMDSAVIAAAQVYVRVGRPILSRVVGTDSPFNSVSAEDFINGDFNLYGFGHTRVRMAFVLARIRKAQGRLRESKDFAAYALAHVGQATILRAELERLSASF